MLPFDDTFAQLITIGYSHLIALALAMARAMGMVIVLPVFLRAGITGMLRTGVVIAIALPLLPHALAEIEAAGRPAPLFLTGVILKEGFAGFLLGLAFGVPFWGIQAAGDVVDVQRGALDASLPDAAETTEASVTGTFLVMTMITLFFVSGGMTIVIETLYQSYGIWPLFELLPDLSLRTASLLFTLLDQIMRLAFVVAGPLIIAMFLGDAVLAAISRFAPQLNVFVLSMGVKCAVFTALMPLYAVFVVDHMESALAPLHDIIGQFTRLIR